MGYKCEKCTCEEFVSQSTKYDVFENNKGKLILKKTELMNQKLELFCRECSEKLEFEEKDILF